MAVAKKRAPAKKTAKTAKKTNGRMDLSNMIIVRAEPNPKRKGSAAAKLYDKMAQVVKSRKKIPVAELAKTTGYSSAHFRWDLAHKFLTVKKLGGDSA